MGHNSPVLCNNRKMKERNRYFMHAQKTVEKNCVRNKGRVDVMIRRTVLWYRMNAKSDG
jgi:dTDP-D-glucose 4,6-dehydratase